MSTFPTEIIATIACFAPVFTRPSWEHGKGDHLLEEMTLETIQPTKTYQRKTDLATL